MIVQSVVGADHHSEYLARTLAQLTPQGRQRVNELLEQLGESFPDHAGLARFANARAAEADLGWRISSDAATEPTLTDQELDQLVAGFTTIRDQEPADDVSDWANAVLALLSDEAHRRSP